MSKVSWSSPHLWCVYESMKVRQEIIFRVCFFWQNKNQVGMREAFYCRIFSCYVMRIIATTSTTTKTASKLATTIFNSGITNVYKAFYYYDTWWMNMRVVTTKASSSWWCGEEWFATKKQNFRRLLFALWLAIYIVGSLKARIMLSHRELVGRTTYFRDSDNTIVWRRKKNGSVKCILGCISLQFAEIADILHTLLTRRLTCASCHISFSFCTLVLMETLSAPLLLLCRKRER